MKSYNVILEDVLENGVRTDDRTGVGTISKFGSMFEFDMSNGHFPAVTSKKLAWKAVVSELIWFIRGSTNVDELRQILHGPNSDKMTIWDANYLDVNSKYPDKFKDGDLGPIYGNQWRNWTTDNKTFIDQLYNVINAILVDPNSRRLIVNSWAVHDINDMGLPPCHYTYQFSVKDGELSLAWNQR